MAKNPNKPVLQTKKHLARLEKERLQRRYLIIGITLVGAIIVGLLLFGIIQQSVIQPRQAVAIVNGENISTDQFQTQSRLIRYNLIRQAENTYQLAQYFADDATTLGSLAGQLQQVAVQLDPTTLGQQVLDEMINDRIIRQEAEKKGITVTEEEIDKAIEAEFGFFPEGTPTPVPTLEIIPTSTLSAIQQTLIAPTATPIVTATITATATLAPSPTPTGVITPTATLSPTPTATPFVVEAYRKQYQDFIENITSIANIKEEDIRQAYESILFRERLLEEIAGDQTSSQEQVWARHILVGDEQIANQVVERLNNGENFCDLASELSTDTSNSTSCGDLGWFTNEAMVPEFAEAAFSTAVGEISSPVQSQFGWHVIQVLGHEDRPIDPTQIDQLKQQRFQEWLTLRRTESEIVEKDYWIDRVPTEPSLSLEIQAFIQQALAAQQNPATLIDPTAFPQVTPVP